MVHSAPVQAKFERQPYFLWHHYFFYFPFHTTRTYGTKWLNPLTDLGAKLNRFSSNARQFYLLMGRGSRVNGVKGWERRLGWKFQMNQKWLVSEEHVTDNRNVSHPILVLILIKSPHFMKQNFYGNLILHTLIVYIYIS